MRKTQITLTNPVGLHARPAAQFVQTAARFQAEITVSNLTRNTPPVNAKSILSVLTLGAEKGHTIEIVAQGEDEEEAITTLETLVKNFGE